METPKIIPKLVMAARYQFVIFVVWFVAFPIKGATSGFAKKPFFLVYSEKTVWFHIKPSLFVRGNWTFSPILVIFSVFLSKSMPFYVICKLTVAVPMLIMKIKTYCWITVHGH